MKIIMVAIPNHHFFQWVNQLENAGFEVFWFDITDSGPNSPQISWVKQLKEWKLRWDFPLRSRLKSSLPKVYKAIQSVNENSVNESFNKIVKRIHPDIIHCFEMKLSGLPILKTLQSYHTIPLVYSSWGSDMFYFKELGTSVNLVHEFLKRTDYLITDCKRDQYIAVKNGFKDNLLGVFPGNGGLSIGDNPVIEISERKNIILKGYQFDVGEAVQVLKAIELLPNTIKEKYNFIVYSADVEVEAYIEQSSELKNANFTILKRHIKVPNKELVALMSNSVLHIGNNVSDGMPNTMLEAMSQGCFPIQSNPGNATAEVIKHGFNGYLINNPFDYKDIAELIVSALKNTKLLEEAKTYNIDFINENYNRVVLKSEIVNLYKSITPN